MSLKKLAQDLSTDAKAWDTVEVEFSRLRDLSAERQRVGRMLDDVMQREREAMTRCQLALQVIKNRQEGKV